MSESHTAGTDRHEEAIARFARTLERARASGEAQPDAAALATVDAAGRPSARFVLLKGADRAGFVFYTNVESRKARELAANPRAALAFFWASVHEQVRVEGTVEPVAADEADAYWATRHPESRLSAWASHQSRTLASRAELEARVEAARQRFADGRIPRPEHWSGYRLVPDAIEFWRGMAHRLHERTLYERGADGWTVRMLEP